MSLKSARTAVIAAALLAGTSALALAQSPSQQPSSKEHDRSMNAPQHSQMQPSRSTTGQSSSEKSSQAGHEEKGTSSNTQATPSQSGSQRASDQMKSPSDKNAQGSSSSSEKNAQDSTSPSNKNVQGSTSSSEKNAPGSTSPSGRNAQSTSPSTSSQSAQSPSRSTTASAPAGERVNLTSEQKTQIRSQVIEHGNAPRVSHVDFNVGVGVAVPTSVHLARVPEVLVKIHPGWRTSEYFVYNDEVIIVDPHNRHIVEIIVLS